MRDSRLPCPLAGLVLVVWLASPLAAAPRPLVYRGQLVQQDIGGAETPVRSFAVTAWVDGEGDGRPVIWRVDDEGRGGLPWWESVGRQTSTPRLRHVHLGRPYAIALPGPLVPFGPLALEAEFQSTWEDRPTTVTVTGEQRVDNRDCWVLSADSGNGRRQIWVVEKGSQVLVRASSRLFIGQGERFELQLELDPLDPPATASKELDVTRQLLQLRESLEFPADASVEDLSPEQLARVEAKLPELTAAAQETDAEHFIATITAVTEASRERGNALKSLADKIVGQPVADRSLIGLEKDAIPLRALPGEIVVLHFWEYRGKPESPFGQVGYLDFLAGRLTGQPVRVLGVAVDERAGDPAQLRTVRREIKKFTSEFIRVDYPLAIDDGSLLKLLGDPRPLETPLPLWIVIDREGRVAHYRTGLYNADPSRGLTELQDVITKLSNTK